MAPDGGCGRRGLVARWAAMARAAAGAMRAYRCSTSLGGAMRTVQDNHSSKAPWYRRQAGWPGRLLGYPGGETSVEVGHVPTLVPRIGARCRGGVANLPVCQRLTVSPR